MNDGTEPKGEGWTLTSEGRAALDALVEANFDTSRVAEEARPEAERIARLLSSMDGNGFAASDRSLVDVTLARVFRATGRSRIPSTLRLVNDDEDAMDAWVNSGYDASRVPGALRVRAERHEALAQLVSRGAARAADERRISRTLAAVQGNIDRQAAALSYERAAVERGGWWQRLTQTGSVAAMLLIAVSVLWPLLGYGKATARRQMCQNNLTTTAMGLAMYAGSNRDALPMVTASLGGGLWWDVSPERPRANSANLFHLARSDFVTLANLACPGNPIAPTHMVDPDSHDWRSLDEISYSYQIMFGRRRPAWAQPDTVILTDRSPVVIRSARVRQINPLENSPNHAHGGQNALRADGSALWLETPILDDRDNIWLPRTVEDAIDQVLASRSLPPLRGTELPASASDTFVGP